MPRVRASTAATAVAWAAAVLATSAGCTGTGSGSAIPSGTGSPTAGTPAPVGARGQLAIRAAAAKDRKFVATYLLSAGDRQPRTVTVIMATDGTWQIDVPGGAMSGGTDIAIASVRDGLYQCALGATRSCVTVGQAGGRPPAWADPRIQYVFTDWLDVLTNTDSALSVAEAKPISGARGSCYSVELNSASLAAPADPGVYCYLPDGTLTAASVGFGTLVLTGNPGPPPPTAPLPGPVTAGPPLPLIAPTAAAGRA